jgi:hypothetical protein
MGGNIVVWIGRIARAMVCAAGFVVVQSAAAADVTIFDNGNAAGVINGPSAATVFSITGSATITSLMTYHWNGGKGSTAAGTIALRHSDGTTYGPWTATGVSGTLYWYVYPNATIKAGSYTVVDSNPATWSYNSGSGNAGMAVIKGSYAAASTPFDVTTTSSGSEEKLTLGATLTVASQDVGQSGEVYVAGNFGSQWYFSSSAGWVTQLSPYYSGKLPSTMSIPVLTNLDLSLLGGLGLYVGYGNNASEMVNSSRYKNIYKVAGRTPYGKGEFSGQDAYFNQVSDTTAKTTGALLQAILAVNSLLYTDPSASDLNTFTQRKDAAYKALATLQTYAQQGETMLAQSGTLASGAVGSFSALRPEDVLATVASGPSKTQLKTLMNKYGVGAVQAKQILDSAMAGLISDYNNTANFYNTAARTANLVKEGSGLALTIAGSVVTAGGVTGALTLGEAGLTLITGADGIVKVTKAGLELIKGADINTPGGTTGAVLTTLSDVSEFLSFTSLKKWGDASDRIGNLVYVVTKASDALQDGELNLGAHTFTLAPIAKPLPASVTDALRPPQGTIPSTRTGTYRIGGSTVKVTALPDAVNNVIAMLPASDRVPEVTSVTETVPVSIRFDNSGMQFYHTLVSNTNPSDTKGWWTSGPGCSGSGQLSGDTGTGTVSLNYAGVTSATGTFELALSPDRKQLLRARCSFSYVDTDGKTATVSYTLVNLPFTKVYADYGTSQAYRYEYLNSDICSHITEWTFGGLGLSSYLAGSAPGYTLKSQTCTDPSGRHLGALQVDVTLPK